MFTCLKYFIERVNGSILYSCVIDPASQFYVFNVDAIQLPRHEQRLLDSILDEFHNVFPNELPPHLPPRRIIDHEIDLILGVAPMSIPPYRLSRLEEEEIARQLKEYISMGHIRVSKISLGCSCSIS